MISFSFVLGNVEDTGLFLLLLVLTLRHGVLKFTPTASPVNSHPPIKHLCAYLCAYLHLFYASYGEQQQRRYPDEDLHMKIFPNGKYLNNKIFFL